MPDYKSPSIVCLCGSTRFKDEFIKANERLTLRGKIVLSVGLFAHADYGGDAEVVLDDGVKEMLDKLHLHKIKIADEIYIIDPDKYIGNSTRREIEYARRLRKPIYYLSNNELKD